MALERALLALTRTAANTGAVAAGLAVARGVGLTPALVVGLTAGTLSGGCQYHNAHLQRWLTARKGIHSLLRWYLLEYVFLMSINGVAILFDIRCDCNHLWTHLAQTALLSLVGQGLAELAIADLTKRAAERRPDDRPRFQRMSDLAVLILSMNAVAAAVLDLSGLMVGRTLMQTLAVFGVLAWLSMLLTRKLAERASPARIRQ